jgi:cell shape-determining protein MreD
MFHVKPPTPRWNPGRGEGSGHYTFAQPNDSRIDPWDQPIKLLSALLALATGVIHASLAPLLAMGDVRPNLILAAVVAVTALLGLGAGALWAFVGGLSANLLTTDPLGTIPLGLLLVAALVAVISPLFGRQGVLLAVVGGLAGSVLLDLAAAVVLTLDGSGPAGGPWSLIAVVVPTAVLNAALAAMLYLAGRAAIGRFAPDFTSPG